ncbi:MAG: hypothetical protein ACT4OX_15720 [Actinomycetota bacterium]
MPMPITVHVAGVQPVGSRGLNSVQAVVTDSKPSQQFTTTGGTGRDAPKQVPLAVTAEPVVLHRDGLPVDRRPDSLKHQKAAAKYREAQELAPHRSRARR